MSRVFPPSPRLHFFTVLSHLVPQLAWVHEVGVHAEVAHQSGTVLAQQVRHHLWRVTCEPAFRLQEALQCHLAVAAVPLKDVLPQRIGRKLGQDVLGDVHQV